MWAPPAHGLQVTPCCGHPHTTKMKTTVRWCHLRELYGTNTPFRSVGIITQSPVNPAPPNTIQHHVTDQIPEIGQTHSMNSSLINVTSLQGGDCVPFLGPILSISIMIHVHKNTKIEVLNPTWPP
jgi:hypothetical protein